MEERSSAELLKAYTEAHDRYVAYLQRYFPTRAVVPGQDVVGGEPIDETILREGERLREEEGRAQQAWMEAMRAGL